ncbi:endonuclease/exonuclease/phosphatase family protein [Apiospora hydei]|uniref:Endonuclease/exonuclease/phosphatase family protein n=1 Tax=Apiospora hydei TaxID=1337664 RepID=A0ABR1X4X8_9PEZI
MSKLTSHIQKSIRRLLQAAKPGQQKTAAATGNSSFKVMSQTEPATSDPWAPAPQPHYAFNHSTQEWEPQTATDQQHEHRHGENDDAQHQEITNLALFSWNIDFNLPFAKARMDAALETLRDECVKSDLEAIAEKGWVRDRFYLTDLPTSAARNWRGSSYGTTTLVDCRLSLVKLFRVHYEQTRMQRDALFADVLVPPQGSETGGEDGNKGKIVRLCNTHLESLALTPPFRLPQMEVVARYLKDKDIGAGIVAGDFNAIQDFDRTLHAVNRLRDAYLEMGGREDAKEGYTWGQQASTAARERFGCSRMDKVYYTPGSNGDEVRGGVELPAAEEEARKGLVGLGYERPWVTDHLGIMAEFEVVAQRDEAS